MIPAQNAMSNQSKPISISKAESRLPRESRPTYGDATPNDLWCAEFKGEFKLGDGEYCYP